MAKVMKRMASRRFVKKRKTHSRIIKAVLILVLITGVGVGFYFGFILKSVSLQGCTLEGLEGFLLNKTVGKNLFLIRSNEIASSLLGHFFELDNVKIKKVLPSKLLVFTQCRIPVAGLYYKENIFLVDKEGIIFKKVSEFKNKNILFFKLRERDWVKEVFLGQKLLSPEKIKFALRLNKTLEVENIPVKWFEISGGDFIVYTTQGWKIYFKQFYPKEKMILIKLKVLFDQELPQQKRENLEYVDFRFSKVYYRLTD